MHFIWSAQQKRPDMYHVWTPIFRQIFNTCAYCHSMLIMCFNVCSFHHRVPYLVLCICSLTHSHMPLLLLLPHLRHHHSVIHFKLVEQSIASREYQWKTVLNWVREALCWHCVIFATQSWQFCTVQLTLPSFACSVIDHKLVCVCVCRLLYYCWVQYRKC